MRAVPPAARARGRGDLPPRGGDAYSLEAIIHDWLEDEAIAVLGRCRRVVSAGGALLVIERVVGPPNTDPAAKLSDQNMLVAAGGRERNAEELESLLTAAGFRLTGVTPTASGLSVLEGEPV